MKCVHIIPLVYMVIISPMGGCSILWITDDISTTSFIFPRINIRAPLNNPSLLIAWSPEISRQSIPTLSVSLSNISDYIYDLNNYHHYNIIYSPTTITLKIDNNDFLFFIQSGDFDFSQFLSQSYSLFITRYTSYYIIDAYLKNIYINSTSSIRDLSSNKHTENTIPQNYLSYCSMRLHINLCQRGLILPLIIILNLQ